MQAADLLGCGALLLLGEDLPQRLEQADTLRRHVDELGGDPARAHVTHVTAALARGERLAEAPGDAGPTALAPALRVGDHLTEVVDACGKHSARASGSRSGACQRHPIMPYVYAWV